MVSPLTPFAPSLFPASGFLTHRGFAYSTMRFLSTCWAQPRDGEPRESLHCTPLLLLVGQLDSSAYAARSISGHSPYCIYPTSTY